MHLLSRARTVRTIQWETVDYRESDACCTAGKYVRQIQRVTPRKKSKKEIDRGRERERERETETGKSTTFPCCVRKCRLILANRLFLSSIYSLNLRLDSRARDAVKCAYDVEL